MTEKERYIERHRQSIRKYFKDTTNEGKICKYYTLQEQEYVLESIFKMNRDDIRKIHDDVYKEVYLK